MNIQHQKKYDLRIRLFTARCYASAVYAVIVCPSVCLSHVGVLQRWLNLGSHKQRHTIVPFGTNLARPIFATKSTPSRGPIPKPQYLPHPWTVRPTTPNGIRIRSVVFPPCTGQTDRRTYRPTDRSSTGKYDDYSPLRL